MSVTSNSNVPLNGLTPQILQAPYNPYNPANNQLLEASYDAAGDMGTVGALSFWYDAEGRQTQSYDSGSQTRVYYSYDADGQRVQKAVSNGPATVYIRDAFGNLAAEYATSAPTPSCTTCYLSYDHLGSVRLITDQNAQVVSRHDYLPFGEEIPDGSGGRSGNGFGAASSVNRMFTGKERDGENTPSFDYFGARYYGGVLGRFTGADEPFAGQDAEDPQSWNLYSYGLNNPLRFVDPDGHNADDPNDPCHGNPNCVTVSTKAQGLNPIDELLYRSLFTVAQQSMQIQQVGEQVFNWLSQPRNGSCLSASTAAGASAGAGVGLLGLAGGPAVGITEPTAMAVGGGIGWAGGMVSCMSSSGEGGGGGASSGGASDSSKPPVKATKLRGNQGWRDENGNIWKKDMLHKDHWDVSDRAGKKIKEVTFDGRELWPNGPKNAR